MLRIKELNSTQSHLNAWENGVPKRIYTGVAKQSIRFPTSFFYGDPKDHQFATKKMAMYYENVAEFCVRNGLTEVRLGVELIRPNSLIHMHQGTKRESFVLVAGNETGVSFIWQKYEGEAAGSGQNLVYMNDQSAWKMTAFSRWTKDEQDEKYEPCALRRFMSKL